MSNLFTAAELETLLRTLASSHGLEVVSFSTKLEPVSHDVSTRVVDLVVSKTFRCHEKYLCFERDACAAFRERGQDAPRLGWYERWGGQHPDLTDDQALVELDLLDLAEDRG